MSKKNKSEKSAPPVISTPPWFAKKYFKPLSIVLIIITGLFIYSNTLNNSFHFDDIPSIVNNPAIRDISNPASIWKIQPTRFITFYSFALNYHFHKLDLFGYHLTNITIHILASLAVWWILLLTAETPALKRKKIFFPSALIALFGGLLFVSHPVQTQAVTYIVQRLASLTALFYFISLGCYIKARLLLKNNKSCSFLLFSFVFLFALLAMLSKETGFTLPIIIILYEIFFMGQKEPLNRKLILLFILPAAVILPVIYKYRSSFDQLSKTRIPGGILQLTPIDYLYTQFSVILTYLRLLVCPAGQTIDYDFHLSHTFLNSTTLISFIILLSVLTGGLLLFRSYRALSFAIFFFFIALCPESSIIPIRDVIFEHRLYLPMAGFCMFTGFLPFYIFKGYKQLIPFLFLSVIICTSYLTCQRNFVWKDEVTLWSDAVTKAPFKSRPYAARAKGYIQIKDYTNAITDCNTALQIDPTYDEAYIQRGAAYGYMNKLDKALSDFNKAVKNNPYRYESFLNRARIRRRLKQYDAALSDIRISIQLRPSSDEAYYEKGLILLGTGDYISAQKSLSIAIRFSPHNAEYLYTAGYCSYMNHDLKKALTYFDQTLVINPKHVKALNNRGMVFFKKKQYNTAIKDFTEAAGIDPANIKAYNNRALAYFSIQEYRKSLTDIEKIIALGGAVNPFFLKKVKEKNRIH